MKGSVMGRLVLSQNLTLDGVVQDPTGDEGFKRGGWFTEAGGTGLEEWAKVEFAEASRAAALLFGRSSHEWFATRWATRPGEWADSLRSVPKYVVCSVLDNPGWVNSLAVSGDPVREVTKLKAKLDGDIVVYGSRQLAQTLMEHDLVDELRLMVFPFVLGAGDRLFGELSDRMSVRLSSVQPIGESLAYLIYEVVRDDDERQP
jgi:dihydrofolate reductase